MRSSRKVIKTARLSERMRDIPVPRQDESPAEAGSPAEADSPPAADAAGAESSGAGQPDSLVPPDPLPPLLGDPPPQPAGVSPEEIELLRAQAWEEGQREGFAAGKREAAQLIAVLQRMVDEAKAAREEFIAVTTPQLLNLAVQIAEKIVRREVETDPTVVQRIAEDALRHAVDKHHLRIRVNPEDWETLQAVAPELQAALDDIREFEIVPDRRRGDRRMARGGCLIETESGIIDARIETQLEEIRERLTEEHPDGQLRLEPL
jgi:flagellar assembly protein FliH